MDFASIIPPVAPSIWLDLDALDHNIDLVNKKTSAVNLRIATKSIRSVDVLNYIIQKTSNYIGLMTYNAAESLFLLQQGFDNILCAYPTLDAKSVTATIEHTNNGSTMIWMTDRIEHLQFFDAIGAKHKTKINVCLDINMSMKLPKVYFGTKRSALMSKRDVKALLKKARKLKHIRINALMGYEAQIAGLPEASPNNPLLAPAIRLLKSRSKRQVSKRRSSLVKWLGTQGVDLSLVNGGGSGSMDFTSSQSEVTEITVGSAYYKPAYFDYMDTMQEFKPAAGFVLQVTRQPEPRVVTCHSGGFIASGAIGIDKQPVVIYPNSLSILPDEGFGEVQTPMKIEKNVKVNKNSIANTSDNKLTNSSSNIAIGDFVWCRHAKAGELCEHFNDLYCYRVSKIVDNPLSKSINHLANNVTTMATYRKLGHSFH